MFLSYSRMDQPLVVRLAAALEGRGFVADWDQTRSDTGDGSLGIAAEDVWWRRLQDMIAAADVMVFVVSPDSAASRVCDEEIAYARALEKRIVPVLARPIDFGRAPPRLAALNVAISLVPGADVDAALDALATALERDVTWVRELTRLTLEARRWRDDDRAPDVLLLGDELRDAESWAARRPTAAPELPSLILDFLDASRAAEATRRDVEAVQRLRYQEIDRVARPLLEAELAAREARPPAAHAGVAEEDETHKDLLRSLLGRQVRWHPQPARHVASGGARDGYVEIFDFPCCELIVRDFLATSDSDAPSQFRSDGCQEIPPVIQYESRRTSNPFGSVLLVEYEALRARNPTGG